jgi:hypothetical protein
VSKRCRECVVNPRMNKASTASIRVAALCMIMVGCSSKTLPEGRSQARVVFQSVQDPIRELCTDDTSHRSDYFTGPLVRFEASTIVLKGAGHRPGTSSAERRKNTSARRSRRSGSNFHRTACYWLKALFCGSSNRCLTLSYGGSTPNLIAATDS